LPVIIQDASGYAGSSVPMAVQAALFREHPERILFKPEGPQRSQSLTALREATGGDAAIFDGMGGITLIDSFSRGIAGIMGSADLSWAVVELWRALKSGKTERAWQIQAPLSALVALMQSLDAFVVIGKTLFVKQGIFKNPLVRGPLGFKLDRFVELDLDRHLGNLKRACL
jgi:4-hydroxy-tetrahydrodipicolinate synthase